MFSFEKEKELLWKSIHEIRDVLNRQADVIKQLREEKGQLPEKDKLYRNNYTGTIYIVKDIVVNVSEGSLENTEMVLFTRIDISNAPQWVMGVNEFNKKFKKAKDD